MTWTVKGQGCRHDIEASAKGCAVHCGMNPDFPGNVQVIEEAKE